MASNVTVDADRFADAMRGILTDAGDNVRKGAKKAVRDGARVAKRSWSDNAPRMRGKYAASITYTVRDGESGPYAEVGSKTMPGMPHLLEKGHAIIGGGRSRAFPHVAPAADEGFEKTLSEMGEVEL